MKYLFLALAISSLAVGHPPLPSPLKDSIDSEANVQFRNGDKVAIVAKDYKLKSLRVIINGKTFALPEEEFSGIPFPDLGMLSSPQSDGENGRSLSVVIEFGKPPIGRGDVLHDGLERRVRFDFSDKHYKGRTVTIVTDPSRRKPPPQFFKAPGMQEVPASRCEGKKQESEQTVPPNGP
jgi:hypothetical protein